MRVASAAALATLFGLLGACGGSPSMGGPGVERVDGGAVFSASPAVLTRDGDGDGAMTVDASALTDKARAGVPATPPSELALIAPPPPGVGRTSKLQSMIAKSDEELAQALGTPDFKRTDGDAQIWQYRSTFCILDAFLYRGRDGVRVRHLETRGLDVRRLDADACFIDLLAAHAAGARAASQTGSTQPAAAAPAAPNARPLPAPAVAPPNAGGAGR